MATLAEMVAKGRRKLEAKTPVMRSNWESARPKMRASYESLPFGPRTKASYIAGIDAGVYRTPDVDKWGRNWEFAVSR